MKLLDFFAKLFFFLADSHDPEKIQKRRLKQLARELSRNRFASFYKPKHGEATAALANFLYEIYKTIAPAQSFLQNAVKSALLKQTVVEFFLDKNIREIKEYVTAASIEIEAQIVDIPELIKSINSRMAVLSAAFDTEQIKTIDRCYANILSMARFVTFDFFSVLKKFDSRIVERDPAYKPSFSPLQGLNLSDEIKELLELAFPVDPSQNWVKILQILKTYRNGIDVVNYGQWTKILGMMRDVLRSGMLELMVRHIEKDPAWQFKPKNCNAVQIAEKYLEAKQLEVKTTVEKIIADREKKRQDELVLAAFGRTEIQRAQYYTQAASESFTSKHFDGFLYAAAINYLMAFLLEVFGHEFNGLCDLILVRGRWAVQDIARETSEHYHLLTECMDKLVVFDNSFSEEGENGADLYTALARLDREQNRRIAANIIGFANEEALELIHDGVRSITVIGRNLDTILNNRQEHHHNLIANWDELEAASAHRLAQRITAVAKQTDAFIKLMSFLVKNEEDLYD
jgi:hypothetical protein